MKGAGWQAVFIVLLVAVFILWPVCADPIPYTITSRVIFTENGSPLSDSIQFQMTCYGHTTEYFAGDNRFQNATTDNPVPLKVVAELAASCSPGDCLFSRYDYWNPAASEFCRVNGTVGEALFSGNITVQKGMVTCTDLPGYSDYNDFNGTRHYFHATSEYSQCLAEAEWFFNCSAIRDLRGYQDCRQMLEEEQGKRCVPSYEEFSRLPYDGQRYCEYHMPLPPGGFIPAPASTPPGSSGVRVNLIESFPCNILRPLGVRCG